MIRASRICCGPRLASVLTAGLVALVLAGASPATRDRPTVTVLSYGGSVTSNPAGIMCPPTCSASFAPGTVVVLSVKAEPTGLMFFYWQGNCTQLGQGRCRLKLGAGDVVLRPVFDLRPSPPPTGVGPLDEEIPRVVRGRRIGRIAFTLPEELRLGDSVVIHLALSAERSIRELQKGLTELGKLEGAEIEISSRMSARLTGFGFRIEAITPELQAVRRNRVTDWKWEVQATETGAQFLHLTLAALVDVDGAQTAYAVQTFDRQLEIRVGWAQRVGGFLGDNWQWLWSVVLIPVIGWLWRSRPKLAT